MTQEQLREIDRLMAEKVMGWDCVGHDPWIDNRAWRPSVLIEDTWDVMEKLRETHVVLVRSHDSGWCASAHVRDMDDPSPPVRGVADTASLAISLVALAAKGVEVST